MKNEITNEMIEQEQIDSLVEEINNMISTIYEYGSDDAIDGTYDCVQEEVDNGLTQLDLPDLLKLTKNVLGKDILITIKQRLNESYEECRKKAV